MNLYGILCSITVITNVGIIMFLMPRWKDNKLSRLLSGVPVAGVVWTAAAIVFSTVPRIEYDRALFWWQVGYFGPIFGVCFFLHFIVSYLRLNRRKLLRTAYFLAVVFYFFVWFNNSSKFLVDLKFVYGQFYWHDWLANKNPIFLVYYLVFFVGFLGYAFIALIKAYYEKRVCNQNQIKYFILGSSVGWLGSTLHYLSDFGIDIYPWYVISIAVYPFIFVYAIVKHHLMDVNIVFKKGLVYSTLVAVITAGYLALIMGIGKIFQGLVGYQSFVINLLAVFIIGMLFNPLRDWIQHFLDKRFFQGTLESLAQERQRLQQELFHKEKLAYVGQLASSVVHEIKSPLTAIKTYVEHVPEKYADEGFRKKFQHLVPKEIDRINRVVEQLLDLAKPKNLDFNRFDLISVIESTFSLLEEHFKFKKIRVKREYSTDELLINGDEEHLRQVFLNLFLNAVQAMKDGGEMSISVDCFPESARINVKDTGEGIPKNNLEKIFTPFHTTKKDGIGLGMSITKEIIELHKGSIHAESRVGEGTTFIIELPTI